MGGRGLRQRYGVRRQLRHAGIQLGIDVGVQRNDGRTLVDDEPARAVSVYVSADSRERHRLHRRGGGGWHGLCARGSEWATALDWQRGEWRYVRARDRGEWRVRVLCVSTVVSLQRQERR